jgi:hypothetical protein
MRSSPSRWRSRPDFANTARWLLGSEINLMGVEALGMGLGTLILRLHQVSPLAAVRAAIKSAAHLREMTNAGKNFCCTGG